MPIPDSTTISHALQEFTDIVEIAKGGQKVVHKAKHPRYGTVVIKILLDTQDEERAHREIEIAKHCDFPNVPKLYESGHMQVSGERFLYIIEQLVEGETLRTVLNKEKRLGLAIAIPIIKELLLTAVQLENQDVVHRDIKPENIILGSDQIWLLDFGIARHLGMGSITKTGAPFGPHTPGYAAPEQFQNLKKKINIRTDLFSIGVVSYEMLSGVNPFRDGVIDVMQALYKTATFIPKPIVIKGDSQRQLGGFISTLMEKYPTRRPKTAAIALDWFNALLPTIKLDEGVN